MDEIAAIRNIEASTIIGHLGPFILEGEINLTDVLQQQRIDAIKAVIDYEDINNHLQQEISGPDYKNIQAIPDVLGDHYSWNEIKFVYKVWRMQQMQKAD